MISDESVTLKGDKDESKTLRWLQKAASKNPVRWRGGMMGIYVKGDAALCTDGFRLHAVRRPEILEDQEGRILVGDIRAGDFESEMKDITSGKDPASYPDASKVVNHSKDKRPVAEFSINPKYLREALQNLDKPAKIVFYGGDDPIHIIGKDRQGNDAFVLVMPMFDPRDRETLWRPDLNDRAEE